MKYVLARLLFFVSFYGRAQEKTCTQGCDGTQVLLFDFDVKASKSTTNPELYKRLFYVAPLLRKNIAARASCLDYYDGNEVRQPEDVYREGDSAANVFVQGPGAYSFAEYLLTGTVTGEGTVFLVTANIETSTSRKKIKTVQATLNFAEGDTYVSAAQKLEAAFGPLEGVIKDYETRERENNDKVAFGKPTLRGTDLPKLLVVKPKKTKLQMGEETEVEITLKDCDGYPLKNRTVLFIGETIDSAWRSGTYGGTVTPSRVVTNTEGKAKVKFKAGKEYAFAAIVAHYNFEQPCGRKEVLTGSAAIDMQLKPYRVIAVYTQSLIAKTNYSNTTSEYTERTIGHRRYEVQYVTEFYYAPRAPQDGLSVNSLDDSTVCKIYVAEERGGSTEFASSQYRKRYRSGETFSENTLLNANGNLSPEDKPMFSADTAGLHSFSLALQLWKTGMLNGKILEPGLYPGATITAYEGDGHTQYKLVNISDPDSPYKLSPIFQYENETVNTDRGTTTRVTENILVRIFIEK